MMQVPAQLYPDRVADATIRGFLTQAFVTTIRWLALGEHELLLCEGDEDVDRFLFEPDGSLREIRQEQVKDITGALSARSPTIHESLFNFVVSFASHDAGGRRCRFVLVTSASQAKQRVKGASDRADNNVPLTIDVLREWSEVAQTQGNGNKVAAIAEAGRALVAGYAPTTNDKENSRSEWRKRIDDAIAYLDRVQGWRRLIDAVEWRFEEPSHAALESLLHERVAGDPRTAHAPDLLALRLVFAVFSASSRPDAADRLLSRADLDRIAGWTRENLEKWAEAHRASRLSAWFRRVDEELEKHGLELDAAQAAIATLSARPLDLVRRASDRARRQLDKCAITGSGAAAFTLERSIVHAMADMNGWFVVVGLPGSGKSGALSALVRHLEARGEEVYVVAPDASEEQVALLNNLGDLPSEGQKRTLIVDALDAARGEAAARRVRSWLQNVRDELSGWRVVASIRMFDLEARSNLASVFKGKPHPTFGSSRFSGIAHVVVPPLTDEELAQIAARHEPLATVITGAPGELRELLRVPFNTALVAEMLAVGAVDLRGVATQVDLLDRYWSERVETEAATNYTRRALLERACDEIVRARRFSVRVNALTELSSLAGLLSDHVLVHPPASKDANDMNLVAFPHHLLFDFACARVWMPCDAGELASRLRVNADLILVARPSFDMYLLRLWSRDRAQFWNTLFVLAATSGISEVVQLAPISIVARHAVSKDDVVPLLNGLRDPASSPTAVRTVQRIAGALLQRDEEMPGSLLRPPWPSLIDELAAVAPEQVWGSLLTLLRAAAERKPEGNEALHLGRAALALLARALPHGNTDHVGLLAGCVAMTFQSDPTASRRALEPLLCQEAIATFGHETLPRIARAVTGIVEADQAFTERIFDVVFRAASDAPIDDGSEGDGGAETPNGDLATMDGEMSSNSDWVHRGGPIMGFRFQRRDLMQSAAYELSQHFPTILARHPSLGTRVLVGALRSPRRWSSVATAAPSASFFVSGRSATFFEDGSAFWDSPPVSHDTEVRMLDSWQNRLIELSNSQGPDFDAFLNALIVEGKSRHCGGEHFV